MAGAADVARITVTDGQLRYEWGHLLRKLQTRSPSMHDAHAAIAVPAAHPLFAVEPGGVAGWERVAP